MAFEVERGERRRRIDRQDFARGFVRIKRQENGDEAPDDMGVGIAAEQKDAFAAARDDVRGEPHLAGAAFHLVRFVAALFRIRFERSPEIDDVLVAVVPVLEERKIGDDVFKGRHGPEISRRARPRNGGRDVAKLAGFGFLRPAARFPNPTGWCLIVLGLFGGRTRGGCALRYLSVIVIAAFAMTGAAFAQGGDSCVTDAGPLKDRIALVVGNQNYAQQGWKLRTPRKDASLLAQRLREVGFSVTLCTDLGQRGLARAFADHSARLAKLTASGSDPVGLIYYAGHGQQFDGSNFLIPVDADLHVQNDVRSQAVTAQLALSYLKDANNSINFVFLDACRDNPLPAFDRSAPKGLALMGGPVGTYIGYSTKPGYLAEDGSKDYSPFAAAFADSILLASLTAEAMFKAVAERVYAETNHRQLPWQEGIILGDFCFAGCGDKDFGETPARLQAALASDEAAETRAQLEQEMGMLGGFPIRKPEKGAAPLKILVDAYGAGPYKTISAALEVIAPGGVIEVAYGEYNEYLLIKKSVAIIGQRVSPVSQEEEENASPRQGGIDGAGGGAATMSRKPLQPLVRPAPGSGLPCLSTSSGTTFVHIENISFEAPLGSRFACVELDATYNAIVESDITGGGVGPALSVGSGFAQVLRNRISAGGAGVSVEQFSPLAGAVINDNVIAANRAGVKILSRNNSRVVVSGNEIFDNLSAGIEDFGRGESSYFGNKIRNNKGSGVVLGSEVRVAKFRFNEIVGNEGDGFSIPFGARALIEDNEIVGNLGKSIFVSEGDTPTILNNLIDNNRGDGKRRR